jgi:hypothetical protein
MGPIFMPFPLQVLSESAGSPTVKTLSSARFGSEVVKLLET